MIRLLVLRLVMLFHWSSVVRPALNDFTVKFVVVRPGQIPVEGVWPLATASSSSVMKCVQRCWRTGDIAGCVAFVYRPNVCTGTSGLQAAAGSCDFLQYFNLTALSYGLANSICEKFYVSPAVNIAVNKPTSQISTYDALVGSCAVDGNRTTIACTNSGNSYNPWWSVDLQQPYSVGEVVVVNDNDAYNVRRLDNFLVLLTNTQPTVGQQLPSTTLCAQFNGGLPVLGTGKVVCPTSLQSYRYVIVQGFGDALCLAEVAIYVVGN